MIHCKNSDGELFGFESDGSQDDLIGAALAAGMVEITANELASLQAQELAAMQAPITVITMAQCRKELLASGYLATIKTAIAAQPEAVQIDWEFSSTVRRDNPLVTAMAAVLNLSSDQVDAMFTRASLL